MKRNRVGTPSQSMSQHPPTSNTAPFQKSRRYDPYVTASSAYNSASCETSNSYASGSQYRSSVVIEHRGDREDYRHSSGGENRRHSSAGEHKRHSARAGGRPSSSGLIRLSLHKPMGIVFEANIVKGEERGVKICELSRLGVAAQTGRLEVGDELLSIDDVIMSQSTFDEVMDFIMSRPSEESVDLLFRRPRIGGDGDRYNQDQDHEDIFDENVTNRCRKRTLKSDMSMFSVETEQAGNLTSHTSHPPMTNEHSIPKRSQKGQQPPRCSKVIVARCQTNPEVLAAFRKVYNSSSRKSRNSSIEKISTKTPTTTTSLFSISSVSSRQEYAIDIVTKNAQHKVAALWRFDRRRCNGVDQLCVGSIVLSANTSPGEAVTKTAFRALDVLGVEWGMSRCTVLLPEGWSPHLSPVQRNKELQPRFLEFTTQYETEFFPLVGKCMGYNPLDMLFISCLNNKKADEESTNTFSWDDLPVTPTLKLNGAIIHIICYQEGNVVDLSGVEEIQEQSSVLAMEIYPPYLVGNYVTKTVDRRSEAGWLRLVHADEKIFLEDYERVMILMKDLFVVEND